MELAPLFDDLESQRFERGLNKTSGLPVYLMQLEDSQSVQALIAAAGQDAAAHQQIYDRLIERQEGSDDTFHAQQYDSILSAYLYVLSQLDQTRARQAAQTFLEIPALYWSRLLAEHILEPSGD